MKENDMQSWMVTFFFFLLICVVGVIGALLYNFIEYYMPIVKFLGG